MTAIAHHPHRVATAVADARASLAQVAGVPVWSMDATQTTATIDQLAALAAQVVELQARILAHADQIGLASHTGAIKTATWHAHRTRTTKPSAFRLMRLTQGLDGRELTRTALANGEVHAEQAEVILRALADLPGDLDADLVAKAEAHLLAEAAHHDAKTLKILGRRLLEVIDPDAADAHEAELLEKEERDAQAAVRLNVWEDARGRLHGKFILDGLTGAMLKKALFAFAAPKHRAATAPLGERQPTPERLGRAFTEMIERYPTRRLPKAGGLNATVVVTMTLETLSGGLKSASLDTGGVISPGQARRLACEAAIIPAVLGGQSEVLDLGRSQRFYQRAHRIKAMLEHQGRCAVDGCDQPGSHMHHPERWADGGETNGDGIPLCPGHHGRAHDTRYAMTRLPTGTFTFHRRM